jgi:hypothetical protein
MVDFLFIWNSLLFLVLVFMNAFTWLMYESVKILNKFQLFLFYEQVQVCIVSARSALTESVFDS